MPTPMRLHTEHADGLVLVTGATGLLGSMALKEWASRSKPPSIAVLVRDPLRWRRLAGFGSKLTGNRSVAGPSSGG